MSEFAYLRDLTERGEDVDPTDVTRLIHFQPQQTSEDNQQNQTTIIPPDSSTWLPFIFVPLQTERCPRGRGGLYPFGEQGDKIFVPVQIFCPPVFVDVDREV